MDENRVYRAPTARPYAGRQFTNVGLEQLRHALCTFATERAWTQHHTPRNLLLSLVKEIGELSGIFQWRAELQSDLAGSVPQDDQQRLAQALADVLLYLLRLADVCGVDLGRAALQKLADNAAKYPKQQQQQQQQHQNSAPIAHSDGSASSTIGSCSTPLELPVHQQTRQQAPASCLSSGLLHLQQQQQQQQQQGLSPMREARWSSRDAANPGSTHHHQQQQPSAAVFISSLPAVPRQHQELPPLLQPSDVHCGSPNLAQGIVGYEHCSRSPSPAAAAAAGSPRALGSPCQLSPRSMASMLHAATAAKRTVSPLMPMQGQAQQQQQQQQQQREAFLGTAVTTGSSGFAAVASSSQASGDEGEVLHSSKAAGLLPQGLLDEIGHCLQRGPGADDDVSSDDDSSAKGPHHQHSSPRGSRDVRHARVVSIGECITPPRMDSSPCMSRSNSAAAPLTPSGAAASRSGSLSNSSIAGSSNSRTNAAAAAAVSAAASAASAAASGSAAASLWLTAAASSGREGRPSALSGALASQQDTATTLTSCGTSQLSWGIFSASSAEASAPASSHGDDSELGSEGSSTPPARHSSTHSSSMPALLPEPHLQQSTLLGGACSGSSDLTPALGFAGLMHSPQQSQQQTAVGGATSSSMRGIPVRSLAAAAAAAAAASGIAPADQGAASAVQQLAAGLLPLDGCGFELCPRCGRLHSGGCDAARKATCVRCFRKAHLGACWVRCACCNLVHAPGKCRASSSSGSLVSRGRRDQQPPVQRACSSPAGPAAAAAAAAGEGLESFPSLSEGMAGLGPPAGPAAGGRHSPTHSQLEFGVNIGK